MKTKTNRAVCVAAGWKSGLLIFVGLTACLLASLTIARGDTQGSASETAVAITSPEAGATLMGKVDIRAKAEQTAKVEFFINEPVGDETYYLGRGEQISPVEWSFNWDTNYTPDGEYNLYVKAYTHNGSTLPGAEVQIKIDNYDEDNTDSSSKDTVVDTDEQDATSVPRILEPKSDTSLTGTTDLAAKVKAARVHFFAEAKADASLYYLGSANESSENIWSMSWDAALVEDGAYDIYAVAYDALGISNSSEKVAVQVAVTDRTQVETSLDAGERDGELLASSEPTLTELSISQVGHIDKDELLALDELNNLKVENITIEKRSSKAANTDVHETGEESAGYIVLQGQGPASSIITIGMYSDPVIATTRTDENGEWVYTLDRSLSEGKHEVYLTVSDGDKQPVGRSAVFEFLVGSAVAADDSATESLVSVASSNRSLLQLYIIGAICLVLAVVIAFFLLQRLAQKSHKANS